MLGHRARSWALIVGGFVGGLVLCGGAERALAHQQTTTFGELARVEPARVGATEISWKLRVRVVDLAAVVPLPAKPADGAAQAAWRDGALAYLRPRLEVFAGDAACPVTSARLDRDEGQREPTLLLAEVFSCGPRADRLRARYDAFFESDRFHQSFTLLGAGLSDANTPTVVFRNGARDAALGGGHDASVAQNVLLYLKLGITHILTGYDHLSFLMALLLAAALRQRSGPGRPAVAASPREAVTGTIKLISAFTVAHSLTLIVQALRPGLISTRWVEPAIAFSVAYVGFENLVPRPPRRRFLLVFGFGLVHGLGFASVLSEIGLPRRGLVLSLLSFNLGVETGQLLVLSLAFPLIVTAARRNPDRFERRILRGGSAIIAAFGTVWLVSRLVAR